jgi:hypothetical protein
MDQINRKEPPAFLTRRQEPAGGQSHRTTRESDAVETGMRAYHALANARDHLISENHKQANEISRLNAEVDHLARENTTLRSERDYYMRHSVEQMTLLNSLSAMLADGIVKARSGALRPNGAPMLPKQEPLSEQDEKQLQDLIARIGRHVDAPTLVPDHVGQEPRP